MAAVNQTFRATHSAGALTATPVKVSTRRGRGFAVRVFNTGTANPLEISFDSGRNWYPVAEETEFSADVAFHFFYLRSTAGTNYSALIFEG